ncbi:hypothetical protein CDD80_2994 [Ophiocordyceps camponoti-rufipedis]|uniref:F-box domain-containing protein n=1 Tax=Ophiocordyceps camponoti-rufipedis TaxID=2004952 RepID=A0A2C5Z5B7_9HYPO|nr:hypothetical protein CDD80_2994 [Ophiocordyceps camponoti-rufipedis]
MSRAIVIGQPRPEPEIKPPPPLFDTLHNSLVLANVVPYLPLSAVLNLAATDKAFRALVYRTPGVFRHIDLSRLRRAQLQLDEIDHVVEIWRSPRLDESLTEDDFYSGPLRGVLSNLRRRDIFHGVQTLVLDGLSVTAELCHDLINDGSLAIRILSVRDVTNLNHGKLRAALRYACRKSRPDSDPKLRALYVFGPKESPPLQAPQPDGHAASVGSDWNHKSQQALTSSLRRDGDAWWIKHGRIMTRPISPEWADCILACEGIVAFDAVLCEGPRHLNSSAFGRSSLPGGDQSPAVATFSVSACESCGSAPEGLVQPTRSPARLPLLSPLPILSSSVQAATTPYQPCQPFVARCGDCLLGRYCFACHKWWCETCYKIPGQANDGHVVVADDSEDEGGDAPPLEGFMTAIKTEVTDRPLPTLLAMALTQPEPTWCSSAVAAFDATLIGIALDTPHDCDACIDQTQRVCRKCCGGYCIIHNEGSSASHGVSREVEALADCEVRVCHGWLFSGYGSGRRVASASGPSVIKTAMKVKTGGGGCGLDDEESV